MKRNVNSKFLIGIDEAGRGPLAGPVVVAGVRIESGILEYAHEVFNGIKDSKQLTPRQREEWYDRLTNHSIITWAVARISPGVIDRINIAKATNRGAYMVYKRLMCGNNCNVLLDGSLYLPRTIVFETIIKGDEKIPVISAASIIAKVTRDRIMTRLHKKYPAYGFDAHKGYGTRKHGMMIAVHGLSPIHRLSFRMLKW